MSKISLGLSALAVAVSAVLAFLYADVRRQADDMRQHIAALEAQMLGARPVSLRGADVTAPTRSRAETSASAEMPRTSRPSSNDAVDNRSATRSPLSGDLRQEVAAIVEEERDSAREKRREEWETRMKEGFAQSLMDFADDLGIDAPTIGKVQVLFNDIMDRRAELQRELHAQNMSFYEFRQESRKFDQELHEKMSQLLSQEQLEAFADTFPMGRGGMMRPGGGPGPR
ncbi:MAG: hypothetical protein M0R76_06175 [Proteobacteria bacterium]|nr:hypothetical protein [Pseudomonadota bacterium]